MSEILEELRYIQITGGPFEWSKLADIIAEIEHQTAEIARLEQELVKARAEIHPLEDYGRMSTRARNAALEEAAKVAGPALQGGIAYGISDYGKQAYDIRFNIATSILALRIPAPTGERK